jgi:signal transduction histidine kinase
MAGIFLHLDVKGDRTLDSLIHLANTTAYSDSVNYKIYSAIARNKTVHVDTILKYARFALSIAENTNKERWEASCLFTLGDAYRLKGELEKSIQNYLAALSRYEKYNNAIGIAATNASLGNLYHAQGNFNNAIHYNNIAIEIFRQEKDSIRLAESLLNTGEFFREGKHYNSSKQYFKESADIFKKLNYPIGTAYNLGNIGLVYAELGQHQYAESQINLAIDILEDLGDYYPIAIYLNSLADIYEKNGDYQKAIKFALRSLTIGQNERLNEQIRDASLKLSELYKLTGENRKAFDYLKQYITYRDSINNLETVKKMADLRTEYEVSKKQKLIDLKQIEVDLLNVEARKNQVLLWSVIIILVLLLFSTYMLLKVYRLKDRAIRIIKKRRRIITAQRNKLEGLNQTKDKFFSIISHDIRGPISNFQGIAQLIELLVKSNDTDGLLKLGGMLDSSSKEISALLDNLLEWAMSQQGQIPYQPENIPLQEICDASLSIMNNLATAKQIKLTGSVNQEIKIFADKNSTATIIRNLLNNAIKFTSIGGQVRLGITQESTFAVIEIVDTGIGMEKDQLDTLFNFKGKRSSWGTSGEKGVGLGLTLAHEFTEMNKGKIEVKSEIGIGTTFKVFLPLGS